MTWPAPESGVSEAELFELVILWAERRGLDRLAAYLRRHRRALEPQARELHARVPECEQALDERQAALWRRRGS